METAQKKVQTAVESMIDGIDKGYLRKMQCCEDTKSSADSVQRCVDLCQKDIQTATTAMDNEMKQFQERLMRCAQSCEDKAKDSMGTGDASKVDMSGVQKVFEGCVVTCADDHIGLLPNMQKRLEGNMKKML